MHKLRLKKLETKQRAQEERSKRDAEIQRVSPFKIQRFEGPKTPFSNYRDHIATMLYRNIVSVNGQCRVCVGKIIKCRGVTGRPELFRQKLTSFIFSDKMKKMLVRSMFEIYIQKLRSSNFVIIFQCLVQLNELFYPKMRMQSETIADLRSLPLPAKNRLKLLAL